MRTPTVFSREPLTIYLNDHLAGATAGAELAHRVAAENEGTAFSAPLARLASGIAEDRDALLAIMEELEIPVDRAKVALGWTAEKVGRLKPNGQLRGYTPLGRLLELEAMLAGVQGKQGVWRSLLHARVVEPAPLEQLLERARSQIAVIQRLHRVAAALAIGDAAPAGQPAAAGG